MQLCCIPLRDLRNLRENKRKRTQSISTNETPKSPADLADLRRQITKQQNSLNLKQTVFLCDIMQLCCIRLRDLRNLRENNTQAYSIYIAQMKPKKSPADHAEKDRCDIVEILPFMLFFPFRSFSLFFPYVFKRPLLLFFIFIDIVFVCVNGLFSRRSRRLRRGMQQGCIISQTKDS